MQSDHPSNLEIWEERHANHTFQRAAFIKLYKFIVSATGDDECPVRVNCSRLQVFFNTNPSVLAQQLERNADHFNTLFNLFDLVHSEGIGSSDARISVDEFIEGLEMLNFQDLNSVGQTTYIDGLESRLALFSPPTGEDEGFTPGEFVVSYYYRRGLQRDGLDRSAFLELCTLLSLCGDHANRYLIDDLDAALHAVNVKGQAWATTYRRKLLFACQFRDRLKLVVKKAISGYISPFSWSVVFATIIHGLFQPIVGLVKMVDQIKQDINQHRRIREITGMNEQEGNSQMLMNPELKPFSIIIVKNVAMYLIVALGYCLLVAPTILFTYFCEHNHHEICCVIPLEAYLPG